MSPSLAHALQIALLSAACCALLGACGAPAEAPPGPAGEEQGTATGRFEGTVTQTIRGTPPIERESKLVLVFDDEGRLASWQGQPQRSYVLARLLEEQQCAGADAEALLAEGAVLQVDCPEGLVVTFRTLEYRTEPSFGLLVELAADGTPLPEGEGRTRGRGSEVYRLTSEGLVVEIYVELVFELENQPDPVRIEQRIEGVLSATL